MQSFSNRQTNYSDEQWLEETTNLLYSISDHISTLRMRGLRTSPNDVPLDTEIVNLAMMSDRDEVDLRAVARDVLAAVTTRTEAWYREKYPRGYNVDVESDASIRDLVKAIFFDADGSSTV